MSLQCSHLTVIVEIHMSEYQLSSFSPSLEYQSVRLFVALSKAAKQSMRYSAKMKSGVSLSFSRL